MPRTVLQPVTFNDAITQEERITALNQVQTWLNTSELHPFIKDILLKVVIYANNNLIATNKADKSRYATCQTIFNSLNFNESFILGTLYNAHADIRSFMPSDLRKALLPAVYENNAEQNAFIEFKMNEFKQHLAEVAIMDSFAAGAGGLELLVVGAFSIPFALLIMVIGESIYTQSSLRANALRAEQKELTELYNIYLWATAKGPSSTNIATVIKLVDLLAYFMPTKKLMLWSNHQEEKSAVPGDVRIDNTEYSDAFYQIMERPPHSIIHAVSTVEPSFQAIFNQNVMEAELKRNVRSELAYKEVSHHLKYGFWSKLGFSLAMGLYGAEDKQQQNNNAPRPHQN
jgi:hypothetical protein